MLVNLENDPPLQNFDEDGRSTRFIDRISADTFQPCNLFIHKSFLTEMLSGSETEKEMVTK